MATQSRRPAPRRSGGGFWLALAVILGGIGAVFVFAPQIPRSLFGSPAAPEAGPEPVIAQSGSTDLATRTTDTTDSQLTQPSQVVRTASAPTQVDKPDTVAAPVKAAFPDEAKAQEILAKAEAAYRDAPIARDWTKAVSLARSIAPMDAKPATLVRAQDIVKGAAAMEKLFRDLDAPDELARNYETNPSLVLLIDGATTSQAVPIRSMDDKTVIDGDPVAWLANQRRTGSVTILLRGKNSFSPAKLPADRLGQVEKADVTAIIAEKRAEFESKLAQLKNSEAAKSAVAWYHAAKFAYQNRLDDKVVEMMDKALLMDPRLAETVREDRAAALFANVVLHLNNNNTKQASGFMAIIDRRFGDTPSGIEARAFYDLKTKQGEADKAAAQAALKRAREEARQREEEETRRRREEKIARAKQLGDEEAVKQAKEEPAHDEGETALISAGPVTGDEAKADELYAKGRELYQLAIDAGNSTKRDDLYGEANTYLTQAQNIYNTLLEKDENNGPLSEKAFMCNKLRYGTIKQKRPFH